MRLSLCPNHLQRCHPRTCCRRRRPTFVGGGIHANNGLALRRVSAQPDSRESSPRVTVENEFVAVASNLHRCHARTCSCRRGGLSNKGAAARVLHCDMNDPLPACRKSSLDPALVAL